MMQDDVDANNDEDVAIVFKIIKLQDLVNALTTSQSLPGVGPILKAPDLSSGPFFAVLSQVILYPPSRSLGAAGAVH